MKSFKPERLREGRNKMGNCGRGLQSDESVAKWVGWEKEEKKQNKTKTEAGRPTTTTTTTILSATQQNLS